MMLFIGGVVTGVALSGLVLWVAVRVASPHDGSWR